jgi:hypothetical protein
MAASQEAYELPRKPLPSEVPLRRKLTRSHSTLWRPWSPIIATSTLKEYERSIYKYPWLDSEQSNETHYEDLEGGYGSIPQMEDAKERELEDAGQRLLAPVKEHPSDNSGANTPPEQDPNLVSVNKPFLQLSTPNSEAGHLGLAQRPREPQELAQIQEMDRHRPRILLHFYLSRLLDHAGPCPPSSG